MKNLTLSTVLTAGVLVVALLSGCASAEVRAVRSGDIEALRDYINSGGDVNAPQRGGVSLLMIAAQTGQVESANLLLQYGARTNTRDSRGRTALMYAAGAGQIAMIELLLNRGVEIDARDNGGATALILAASGNRTPAVELLLDRGADLSISANGGWTAFLTALDASAGGGAGFNNTAVLLINRGAVPDVLSPTVASIAFKAAANGNEEVLSYLVAEGFDPGTQSQQGNTLLIVGVRHRLIVLYLLEMGLPVDERNAA
jgi:ankyrin repeat protein